MKILGIHFSYDKKIENKENFIKLIKRIENLLNKVNSQRQIYNF